MALRVERAMVSAALPARWQIALQRWRAGISRRPDVGCLDGEVAVIAKVRDVERWHASADLRPGAVLGKSPDGNDWLMTARVPLARVEALLADPGVLQLEPAQPLRPLLDEVTVELGAMPELLPTRGAERLGAGAIVGIIDTPCDWRHANFASSSGRPRVAAYWDQQATARADRRVHYGAVWDRGELWMTRDVPVDDMTTLNSHGTHMLDVATGNGRGGSAAGVAPRADIVYVAMPRAARRNRSRAAATVGDTVRLLEGTKFIFDQAGSAPCAVNISLGTNAGPHDGTTLVEQSLDALSLAAPRRAILVAAGNNYAADQHAAGTVRPSLPFNLAWHVPCGGRVRHSLEVWYRAADRFDVELIAPRGRGACRVAPGENACIVDDRTGRLRAFVAHEACAANGDRAVTVFIERGAPAGVWTVRLHPRQVLDGRFHAWIEPGDDVRPVFISAIDPGSTLNSLACGRATIAVGAYDAQRPHLPLAWYASEGPTRDGRPKPDVSAPGHRVWAAKAGTREASVECSGTSLAAAAATGVAALVLAEAEAAGVALSADALTRLLIETCRKHPPKDGWDSRYGHGRIDAAAAVERVLRLGDPSETSLRVANLNGSQR
ncbi:MAG: S8 family serine peptidase [Planctomycetia bacterium]|nr:S8 family serine peptidase [Planctomycetia bacterium]